MILEVFKGSICCSSIIRTISLSRLIEMLFSYSCFIIINLYNLFDDLPCHLIQYIVFRDIIGQISYITLFLILIYLKRKSFFILLKYFESYSLIFTFFYSYFQNFFQKKFFLFLNRHIFIYLLIKF